MHVADFENRWSPFAREKDSRSEAKMVRRGGAGEGGGGGARGKSWNKRRRKRRRMQHNKHNEITNSERTPLEGNTISLTDQ